MRDDFGAGMLVSFIIMVVVMVITLAAMNDTIQGYHKQQAKWVEAGALQYNTKTGKIEPVRCGNEL